jgi:hypothetical protein
MLILEIFLGSLARVASSYSCFGGALGRVVIKFSRVDLNPESENFRLHTLGYEKSVVFS